MKWVEEAVVREREQAEQRRKDEELQLHRARILQGGIPPLWNSLVEACSRAVESYKTLYPKTPEHVVNFVHLGNEFRVERTLHPGSMARVVLRIEGYRVDYERIVRGETSSGSFNFKVNPSDSSVAFLFDEKIAGPEAVSEWLLKPVLFTA